MVVALSPELEKVVTEQADRTGKTPEEIVQDALRRELLPDFRQQLPPPRDEWERLLRSVAVPTGISLTDEQVSREGIYED
jgi:hypothetical protein